MASRELQNSLLGNTGDGVGGEGGGVFVGQGSSCRLTVTDGRGGGVVGEAVGSVVVGVAVGRVVDVAIVGVAVGRGVGGEAGREETAFRLILLSPLRTICFSASMRPFWLITDGSKAALRQEARRRRKDL